MFSFPMFIVSCASSCGRPSFLYNFNSRLRELFSLAVSSSYGQLFRVRGCLFTRAFTVYCTANENKYLKVTYKTLTIVLDHISKHLDVHQKYSY